MQIDWDSLKAESNLKKHGISFDEAATALLDPMAFTVGDDGNYDEVRDITVGLSALGKLLLVVHTFRHENTIRIISARKATAKERKSYEEGI